MGRAVFLALMHPANPQSIPAVAFTCPRCRSPAAPNVAPQRCESCGQRFTLVAGWAGDPSVRPGDPATHRRGFKVKTSGLLLMHQIELEATAFAWGDLDPVVGVARLQSSRVSYPDTVSVAVWRRPNWSRLVANLALGLPLVVGSFVGAATESAAWLVLGVPTLAIMALGIYGAVGHQMQSVRIVSATGEKEFRLRRGGRRGHRFAREALQRVSGQSIDAMP